jgi:hypothetical protein
MLVYVKILIKEISWYRFPLQFRSVHSVFLDNPEREMNVVGLMNYVADGILSVIRAGSKWAWCESYNTTTNNMQALRHVFSKMCSHAPNVFLVYTVLTS